MSDYEVIFLKRHDYVPVIKMTGKSMPKIHFFTWKILFFKLYAWGGNDLIPSLLKHDSNLLPGSARIPDVYCPHQLITDPTRCPESSSTFIDLIFTKRPYRIVCPGVSRSQPYLCLS